MSRYTLKEYQDNINTKWQTFTTDFQITLQAMAQALPEGINGFKFTIEVDESRDHQVSVNVVVDIEFLNGHKWEDEDALGNDEITDLKEFLICQEVLVSEGDYEFFKNIAKMSLQKYVETIRLQKAVELLKTNRKIKEVSEAVGFRDLPYFCRKFKSHWGTTARKMRARIRQG